MATLYTDTGTRQNDSLTQAGKLVKTGDAVTGTLRVARATHTVNGGGGNDATSDVVRAVYLPAGAIPLWSLATLQHEAMGTAYTVKVGTTTDDDAGGSSLDLSSAGTVRLTAPIGTETQLTEGTWVVMTLTSVTSAIADRQATLTLPYVVSA